MLFQQAFSVDETSYVCTISELLCTAQTFRLLAGTNRRLQTQPMMTRMWGTRQIRLAAWGEPLRQHLRSCRATFNITSHHIVPLATPSSTDVYAVSRFPEAASAWTILPDRRAVPCRLTHPTMSYCTAPRCPYLEGCPCPSNVTSNRLVYLRRGLPHRSLGYDCDETAAECC